MQSVVDCIELHRLQDLLILLILIFDLRWFQFEIKMIELTLIDKISN